MCQDLTTTTCQLQSLFVASPFTEKPQPFLLRPTHVSLTSLLRSSSLQARPASRYPPRGVRRDMLRLILDPADASSPRQTRVWPGRLGQQLPSSDCRCSCHAGGRTTASIHLQTHQPRCFPPVLWNLQDFCPATRSGRNRTKCSHGFRSQSRWAVHCGGPRGHGTACPSPATPHTGGRGPSAILLPEAPSCPAACEGGEQPPLFPHPPCTLPKPPGRGRPVGITAPAHVPHPGSGCCPARPPRTLGWLWPYPSTAARTATGGIKITCKAFPALRCKQITHTPKGSSSPSAGRAQAQAALLKAQGGNQGSSLLGTAPQGLSPSPTPGHARPFGDSILKDRLFLEPLIRERKTDHIHQGTHLLLSELVLLTTADLYLKSQFFLLGGGTLQHFPCATQHKAAIGQLHAWHMLELLPLEHAPHRSK